MTVFKLYLFCQRVKKTEKKEYHGKCLTMDGAALVKRVAVALQDPRLLVAVEAVDLIATDVVYHASCFRDNTRECTIESLCRKKRFDY